MTEVLKKVYYVLWVELIFNICLTRIILSRWQTFWYFNNTLYFLIKLPPVKQIHCKTQSRLRQCLGKWFALRRCRIGRCRYTLGHIGLQEHCWSHRAAGTLLVTSGCRYTVGHIGLLVHCWSHRATGTLLVTSGYWHIAGHNKLLVTALWIINVQFTNFVFLNFIFFFKN